MSMVYAVDNFASLSMIQPYPSTELPAGPFIDVVSFAAMAASVTLAAVQDWHRTRYASHCEPSKERLIEHALRVLDPQIHGSFFPSSQVEVATVLLRDLIADAQPTPQVALNDDGSIEALWLVNGTEVLLSVEPSGSGLLAAYASQDNLFEYEFDQITDPLDREKIAEARHLLNGLGESVVHRVLV